MGVCPGHACNRICLGETKIWEQQNTKQNLHMKLNTGGCYLKVCLETRREIESEVGNDRVKNLGEVKGVIGVGRHVW